MLKKVFSFVDERSGLLSALKASAESPIPGGSRWARSFGAVTLALVLLEAVTGIGLSAWYSPSVTDAWASVHYIQFQVFLGSMVRGLHHFGGTALIVVAIIHLLQALVWGAYRAPRELTWISGVLALQVLIIVSHTGFLLPNDLRAYWATQVLLGIAGNQPLIGGIGQTLIQGGPQMGNTTLTHLYTLHVLLVPAAGIAVLALHFKLKSRHGASVPPELQRSEVTTLTREPWSHSQMFKDVALSLLVLLGLAAYTWSVGGVELGAPADPAVEYVARPEWYFLPIFRLRHWFTGSTEFIATTVAPGIATMALCALPFIYDRLKKRTAAAHRLLVSGVMGGLVVTAGLGGMTAYEDATDAKAQKINDKAEKIAHQAHKLAMIGVPVSGPLELYKNDPVVWGARVFTRECAACHSDCTEKPFKGVMCLDGYGSRGWVKKFLVDPHETHFFGNTKIDDMEAYKGGAELSDALAEFLYAQGGHTDANAELVAKGRTAFDKEGCESCHQLDEEGSGDAPALQGWASEAWLKTFIRAPDAERFYGKANEMDAFPHEKLDNAELAAVISYLKEQAKAPLNFGSP
jgi:quinol-cytochrome oxidoreductase complex cytochrome b subunit/mono/diheme cytochrome c family protein